MNIWKIIVNEGYNNEYLTDNTGIQRFDPMSDFEEMSDDPPTRLLKIKPSSKGIPDIMNYWGMNGTAVVDPKVKKLIQQYYGKLAFQFLSCICDRFKKHEIVFWLLNVCEHHDVLDLNKSVCRTTHNLQGEEVISSVKKYVFKKKAFNKKTVDILLTKQTE